MDRTSANSLALQLPENAGHRSVRCRWLGAFALGLGLVCVPAIYAQDEDEEYVEESPDDAAAQPDESEDWGAADQEASADSGDAATEEADEFANEGEFVEEGEPAEESEPAVEPEAEVSADVEDAPLPDPEPPMPVEPPEAPAAPVVSTPKDPVPIPAPVPTAGRFSVETTPFGDIVKDPQARAALEKALPAITQFYDQLATMTLRQIAPMSQGAIDDAKLKEVQAVFDKLQ